jgi:hypothetical protein
LRLLASIGTLPGGGRSVSWVLGHRLPPPHLAGSVAGVPVAARVGAVVPPHVARSAVRAFALLGAGFIEVSPVGPADVTTVREAAAGRRIPVLVRPADGSPDVAAALAGDVDAVLTGPDPELIRVGTVSGAVALLAEPRRVVLVAPDVLVRAGPGFFMRVTDAATRTGPDPGHACRDPWRRPVGSWPAWWWGLLVGVGMIVAGLAAAAITLGPVLLWYDRGFLGTDVDGLHAVNHHLVHFLRHDRITLAGTMVTIGVLYCGLAAGGMRRGWPWARHAYLASGWVGFPTLFYFLATGFLEPLHTAATLVLLPMFVAATRAGPVPPRWTIRPDGPARQWHRALTGQLLLVVTGVAMFAGGAVVSVVGLTSVFVPSDLSYLETTRGALDAAHPRLLAFVAHDRAGFGGALMSAATAITLLSAWGWRRGESWVWWTLAVAAATGFLPAMVVHGRVGYADALHLLPVYVAAGLTVTGLVLARPYLCAAREPVPPGESRGIRREAVLCGRRETAGLP